MGHMVPIPEERSAGSAHDCRASLRFDRGDVFAQAIGSIRAYSRFLRHC